MLEEAFENELLWIPHFWSLELEQRLMNDEIKKEEERENENMDISKKRVEILQANDIQILTESKIQGESPFEIKQDSDTDPSSID